MRKVRRPTLIKPNAVGSSSGNPVPTALSSYDYLLMGLIVRFCPVAVQSPQDGSEAALRVKFSRRIVNFCAWVLDKPLTTHQTSIIWRRGHIGTVINPTDVVSNIIRCQVRQPKPEVHLARI